MRRTAPRCRARELWLPGLLLLACNPGGEPGLRVLRAPGQDGRPVVLDEILVVEFDHRLNAPLRPGAVVLAPEGERPVPVSCEVSGRQILIRSVLPRRPDLGDGTLKPGRRHLLVLRGVPHLAAITAVDGRALVGDRVFAFTTLPASAEDALAGTGARDQTLAVVAPAVADGSLPLLEVGPEGRLRIPLSGPVDPRSLVGAPAFLLLPGGSRQEVPLEVLENRRRGCILGARLPEARGARLLLLPAALRGPGGVRLDPASRRLRLRSP